MVITPYKPYRIINMGNPRQIYDWDLYYFMGLYHLTMMKKVPKIINIGSKNMLRQFLDVWL
jgi:hypothetical protein